ncbi:phage NrS-1 polymerase family protein [Halomicrococcus sp. SG-WS-1]|uniref:phage NrS-1 polymerase family protein n=1 Tax=Halomicrococcus sp. SG-WS-1 TaxID=3439057 RepID=UPI003F7AC211
MSLPLAADVPDQLTDYDQWVCWREQDRDGKPTKVPVNPATGQYASATDPKTWTGFDHARLHASDGHADGVGFVFTADDPFVGVDLDAARDPDAGEPTDWATTIIETLDSYTEISPSGTGYHVLVEGTLPPGRNRRGDVEIYETARFFTVTGRHVSRTPVSIHARSEELTTIYRDHVAADTDDQKRSNTAPSTADEQPRSSTLSDADLIDRARSATNGEKFDRLWRGDITGYDSQSEADMALCCLLAFWTGGDTGRMDSLFRQSDLMREKWDEVHYADGSTYGETTLQRASNVTTDHFTPSSKESTQTQTDADQRATPASITPGPTSTTADERADRDQKETIALLESRLQELEAENDRLRAERDAERAKRTELEADSPTETSTGGFVQQLKQRLFGQNR